MLQLSDTLSFLTDAIRSCRSDAEDLITFAPQILANSALLEQHAEGISANAHGD